MSFAAHRRRLEKLKGDQYLMLRSLRRHIRKRRKTVQEKDGLRHVHRNNMMDIIEAWMNGVRRSLLLMMVPQSNRHPML